MKFAAEVFILLSVLISAEWMCAAPLPPDPNSIGIVAAGQFIPPHSIPGQSHWIPVNQIHQETNLCVPTSAAMVLAHFGHFDSPRELKVWSRGLEYNPDVPFSDFTLTYFSDLLSGLARHGIDWTDHVYANTEAGFAQGLGEIESQIEAGNPVLVDTALYTGHVFVIAGYDHLKGVVIVVDPFIAAPGIREIPSAAFLTIWNSTKVGSNLRAAIFTDSAAR